MANGARILTRFRNGFIALTTAAVTGLLGVMGNVDASSSPTSVPPAGSHSSNSAATVTRKKAPQQQKLPRWTQIYIDPDGQTILMTASYPMHGYRVDIDVCMSMLWSTVNPHTGVIESAPPVAVASAVITPLDYRPVVTSEQLRPRGIRAKTVNLAFTGQPLTDLGEPRGSDGKLLGSLEWNATSNMYALPPSGTSVVARAQVDFEIDGRDVILVSPPVEIGGDMSLTPLPQDRVHLPDRPDLFGRTEKATPLPPARSSQASMVQLELVGQKLI